MYDSINYILTGFKAPFETTERNNMYMYYIYIRLKIKPNSVRIRF